MTKRIAVVLFNLGGPDNLKAVRPFLFNLFNDKAIISLSQPLRWLLATLISGLREKTAKAIYAHMGGGSPLLQETQAQSAALSSQLKALRPDAEFTVVTAMRYWKPLTAETAKAVTVFSPDDIVLLPLYPQYSTTTTGSSLAKWQALYKGAGRTHVVCCYPDQPGLIEAHAQRVLGVLNDPSELTGLRLIFSAHGLPEKVIVEGDPYQHQVERSAEALAARLGVSDWRISYQSRVGPMRWIGPSTIEVIQQAGQDGVGVLVVPIAFVSEHSETLVELDIEYRHLAEAAGVPSYLRAPAVGIEPHFIEGMANMVLNALSMDSVTAGSSPCGKPFGKCPKQRQTRP